MSIEKFEDIIAWQKAKELTIETYKIFKNSKDFNFKSQIERAMVSVMNNIAEGFERKTNNEFKHFLYIAKGSAGEFRSMLYLAKELEYITDEKFKELFEKILVVSKIIAKFIQSLN
ncbi:MAG: four helix bundle protein [Ignavibacteriae bacterium]|nr:four helix bundle protein [Ignavibacteriota bacterium]